ncbi:MAG: rod shape-determining protein MreC [Candidatus Korobacteraceae bacterium]
MDTFLGRYKNLIVLAAILFAQIIGLAVQVRRPSQVGETRLLRLWAISAVTPIEGTVVHAQKWVQNAWTNYVYLRGTRRENRELRAQIERMKIEDARLSEDARMARRVQTLLEFKEQYVESTIAAQVIGTSGSEQSRVLYIDKGSKDGIKTDMAVITPTGIVGKVVQVFPASAQVLPINDQFSGVGALLKDTRLQGILKGSQNGATTLQYVMSDEKVEPGEEVLTSGGDRVFPKGLPVGRVVSVEPGKDLFLNIRVVPSARLDQVEEVLVVTRITEKMPDAKDLAPIRAADILAERLPTVPAKPGTDAAGNPKPAAANAGPAAGAGNPAAGNVAHPSTGTASAKPTAATTTAPGAQPGRTATASPPKPRVATRASTPPTANGVAITPGPRKVEPAPEQTPGANSDQPAKPPATERPAKPPATEQPQP